MDSNGFFVHFFAPANETTQKKHVLFVLDTSGSMHGKKIQQLKKAMEVILDELNPDDIFNIIEFSSSVTVTNRIILKGFALTDLNRCGTWTVKHTAQCITHLLCRMVNRPKTETTSIRSQQRLSTKRKPKISSIE